MTARDDFLAALTAERYDNRWWTGRPPTPPPSDDEVTCARRRKVLEDNYVSDRKETG
jgi:hypothetical protein